VRTSCRVRVAVLRVTCREVGVQGANSSATAGCEWQAMLARWLSQKTFCCLAKWEQTWHIAHALWEAALLYAGTLDMQRLVDLDSRLVTHNATLHECLPTCLQLVMVSCCKPRSSPMLAGRHFKRAQSLMVSCSSPCSCAKESGRASSRLQDRKWSDFNACAPHTSQQQVAAVRQGCHMVVKGTLLNVARHGFASTWEGKRYLIHRLQLIAC
jgi:hypothetical protein